ncbi:hypothetical protein LTR37_019112, partial [Vermiconidia calcicola]
MAVRSYTRDQLLHLRDSPLVEKPDNLPAIEQWLEYVFADKDSREKLRIHHSEPQQQAQNPSVKRQSQSKTGGDASPMGNFSTGLRPSLTTTRSAAGRSEDVSLGPPRTMFPSSRHVAKSSDLGEKSDPAATDVQEARSRFFADKSNRKSMHEKEGRDSRESWTSARERRQLGGDDAQRHEGRYNRRDKDQDGEHRNNLADKDETRWGSKDDKRQNGGWRERDRERKDREWGRGGQAEKEQPEWMDDPEPPNEEDDLRTMGMPRNQEQFQKWKEAMSGKKGKTEDVNAAPASATQPSKEPAPPKATAPLKLEGVVDKPFGSWGDSMSSTGAQDSGTTPAKPTQTKSKGSRFASMFNQTQPKEETPLAETSLQKAANDMAGGAAEDEAGFKRILQMLGGTGIGQPSPQEPLSSPQPKMTANGTNKKSRFTGFFDQTPKSPERKQSPPEARVKSNDSDVLQSSRGFSEEPANVFGGRLPDSRQKEHPVGNMAPTNPISPEPVRPTNGNRDQQQQSGQRMNDIFLEQPPSRGTATPDINIQNLLASQRAQRTQGQDKNSEFLLNLLQTKGSRPSSQQARLENNFPLWLDQPPNMPEPHAPKPRAPPPPGLFEDQLLRNAPPEPSRQEQQPMPAKEMPQRRTSQRAPPPGFYDEQSLFLQQQQQAAQRRNFTEPPQPQFAGRRMSGHPHLPQMQIPQSHQQFAGPPPEFLQSPGAAHQQAPPPGFNPHMPRHPPGFHNIPNIFQPP